MPIQQCTQQPPVFDHFCKKIHLLSTCCHSSLSPLARQLPPVAEDFPTFREQAPEERRAIAHVTDDQRPVHVSEIADRAHPFPEVVVVEIVLRVPPAHLLDQRLLVHDVGRVDEVVAHQLFAAPAVQPRLKGIPEDALACRLVAVLATAIENGLLRMLRRLPHHDAQEIGMIFVVVVQVGDIWRPRHLENAVVLGDCAVRDRRRLLGQVVKPQSRIAERRHHRRAVVWRAIADNAHFPVAESPLRAH